MPIIISTFDGPLGAITAAWFVIYNLLDPLANRITNSLFHLQIGSHLGESVAFFLAVAGLSLRRVLKPQLIAVFIGTAVVVIIITGYLYNLVM